MISGISRTLFKINQRFVWPKRTRDVSHCVKSCVECQSKKQLQERPVGYLEPILVQQPFEKVGLDLIGLFPLSQDGNRHVIIVIEYLTKWVILRRLFHPQTQSKLLTSLFIESCYNMEPRST